MAIFGSYAKGEQNQKSDIDIAIEFDKKSQKTLLYLVILEEELMKFLKKVNLRISVA